MPSEYWWRSLAFLALLASGSSGWGEEDFYNFSATSAYWPETAQTYTKGGTYHLELTESSAVTMTDVLKDFKVETIVLQPGGGIAFRRTDKDYYVFQVADGQASVGRWEASRYVPLQTVTAAASYHPSGPNLLEVDAQGNRFHCYLNGAPVMTVEDTALPTGEVGLYAGVGVHAAFDDYWIAIPQEHPIKEDLDRLIRERFGAAAPPQPEAVFEQNGIKVEVNHIYPLLVKPGDGSVRTLTGRAPDAELSRQYQSLLALELSRYPVSFIRNIGLRKIILTQNQKFDGVPIGGITFGELPQFRRRVEGAIYLDVWGEMNKSPFWSQKAINHELFHCADYKHGPQPNLSWILLNINGEGAPNWGRESFLNRKGNGVYVDALKGYLNTYSQENFMEDRAEIFAGLVFCPSRVLKKMQTDPIIAKKVEAIKSFVLAISPEMDEKFWARMAAMETK